MITLYHFKEGASDKIWGWFNNDRTAISFWGRTGGTLSFKTHDTVWDAENTAEKKERKGYRFIAHFGDEAGPRALSLLPKDYKGQFMIAKLGQTKF